MTKRWLTGCLRTGTLPYQRALSLVLEKKHRAAPVHQHAVETSRVEAAREEKEKILLPTDRLPLPRVQSSVSPYSYAAILIKERKRRKWTTKYLKSVRNSWFRPLIKSYAITTRSLSGNVFFCVFSWMKGKKETPLATSGLAPSCLNAILFTKEMGKNRKNNTCLRSD